MTPLQKLQEEAVEEFDAMNFTQEEWQMIVDKSKDLKLPIEFSDSMLDFKQRNEATRRFLTTLVERVWNESREATLKEHFEKLSSALSNKPSTP